MATEAIQQLISAPAASNLSGNQYYAVQLNSSSQIALATAAKNIDGILQDKPVAGQAGTICRDGITKAAITASSAVLNGSLLEVDTAGTLKLLASGTAIAKAMEANGSAAYITVITVEIMRSNAAFS
jgi:hypothetical protein